MYFLRPITISVLLLSINQTFCIAQNWQKFNAEPNSIVNRLYADTIADLLYVGGNFSQLGNTPYPAAFAQWNGTSFSPNFHIASTGGPFYDLRRINGELYAYSKGLYKLNNNNLWETIGLVQQGGTIKGIEEYGTSIIVYGNFSNISGVPAQYFAKWDGNAWSALTNKTFSTPGYCNTAKTYNGSVFLSGYFTSTDSTLKTFVRYDGDSLVHVPGFGGIANCMEVYNNELYIGGDFSFLNWYGAHSWNIVKYDGSNFSDVGGGMQDVPGVSGINDFAVYHNELYAVGEFYGAGGGFPINRVAKWDGTNWCGFGADLIYAYAIEVYHDSLYVAGAFPAHTNSDSVNYFTKWIGGNFVDTCGNATGVAGFNEHVSVNVFPNPFCESTTISFQSELNSAFDFTLYNQLGQVVLRKTQNDRTLTVHRAGLSSGMYFYSITLSNNDKVLKKGKLIIR